MTLDPAGAQDTLFSSRSMASVASEDVGVQVSALHLTSALSSPGRTRSRSPTWMMPAHTRPLTPIPELWPLKTLEIGSLRGDSMSRAGGSSLSRAKWVRKCNYRGGQKYLKDPPVLVRDTIGIIQTLRDLSVLRGLHQVSRRQVRNLSLKTGSLTGQRTP